MTDSGKNCTLKPVEAAKMPCMRMPGGVGGPLSPSLNRDFSKSVCIVCTPTLPAFEERFSAGQVACRCEKVEWPGRAPVRETRLPAESYTGVGLFAASAAEICF